MAGKALHVLNPRLRPLPTCGVKQGAFLGTFRWVCHYSVSTYPALSHCALAKCFLLVPRSTVLFMTLDDGDFLVGDLVLFVSTSPRRWRCQVGGPPRFKASSMAGMALHVLNPRSRCLATCGVKQATFLGTFRWPCHCSVSTYPALSHCALAKCFLLVSRSAVLFMTLNDGDFLVGGLVLLVSTSPWRWRRQV